MAVVGAEAMPQKELAHLYIYIYIIYIYIYIYTYICMSIDHLMRHAKASCRFKIYFAFVDIPAHVQL